MNSKKVLILTRLFPNDTNKVKGIFVENLVNKQAEQKDYHFTVIAPVPYSNNLLSKLSEKFKKWNGHSKEISKSNYMAYYPKFIKFPSSYGLEWFFILICVWCFIKKNKMQFDIIHSHWLYPDAIAAIILAKLLKIKVVVHNHEAQMSFHTDKRLIKLYLRFFLKKTDLVIPVSKSAEVELIKSIGISPSSIRTKIINNGVDLNKLQNLNSKKAKEILGLNENELHFITIGTLNYKKGHDILIRALGLLKKFHSEIKFNWHVLGEGQDKELIQKLIVENNIDKETVLYGNVDYKNIGLYISACDFFMLTSRHESFGIVFLEALICGKPILGNKVGGVPEFINEFSGVLVTAEDVNDTYNGILKLINKKWDTEFIMNYYTNHYDLSNFAVSINDTYDSLISNSSFLETTFDRTS